MRISFKVNPIENRKINGNLITSIDNTSMRVVLDVYLLRRIDH